MELVPRKAMTMVSSLQATSSFVSCSIPKQKSVARTIHSTSQPLGDVTSTEAAQHAARCQHVLIPHEMMPDKHQGLKGSGGPIALMRAAQAATIQISSSVAAYMAVLLSPCRSMMA